MTLYQGPIFTLYQLPIQPMKRRNFNRSLATGLGPLVFTGAATTACAQGDEKTRKLGIAPVGLGRYSEYQLAPSLQETDHNPANNCGPLSGRTSEGKEIKFEHRRQQGLQMDGFARHILFGDKNLAPEKWVNGICSSLWPSINPSLMAGRRWICS